jgi:hypothetical protein
LPGSKWQNCKARSYTWYNAIKKVNNAAQGNNTPCRTFLLKNTDEMKRFSYLIILLLTTFMVACEYDSPYSNYPVRFVFDSTIHPYNQARSFGEFICIKKGNPGQYKLTDALGNTQTVNIPEIHLQQGLFHYGLGGLIIGTPSTYGDGTMTAYDWACPKCDKARHRVEIDYKSAFKYATCPNCGVKFDLNSGGIPVEGESRPLWRYRIFDNGYEVIVQN